MSYPADFESIQDGVIAKLRLDPTNDRDRVKDFINQTYAQVATETRCFQTNGTADLTADDSYTLDADILHIEELTVTQNGGVVTLPLVEVSLDKINRYRAAGTGTTGPARFYALIGLNQLELWPAPASTDVLNVWYSFLPVTLSDDDDVSLLPEPFGSKLLEYGGCVQAAEFKRDMTALANYQGQYAVWMQSFQRYVNRKAGAYPQAFATWTRMNPWLPFDPSVDIPGYYGA